MAWIAGRKRSEVEFPQESCCLAPHFCLNTVILVFSCHNSPCLGDASDTLKGTEIDDTQLCQSSGEGTSSRR